MDIKAAPSHLENRCCLISISVGCQMHEFLVEIEKCLASVPTSLIGFITIFYIMKRHELAAMDLPAQCFYMG